MRLSLLALFSFVHVIFKANLMAIVYCAKKSAPKLTFVEHMHMASNFGLQLHLLAWNFLLFTKVSTEAIKIEWWPRFFSMHLYCNFRLWIEKQSKIHLRGHKLYAEPHKSLYHIFSALLYYRIYISPEATITIILIISQLALPQHIGFNLFPLIT